jgi:hypothetical protein
MSSKSSKNGAYKILVAQKDAITKITGIITPKSIDTLENELVGAFTILKSTHFTEGRGYRYLACVIPEEKYRIVITDPVWVYAALVNPGAYAATALAAGVSRSPRNTRKCRWHTPSILAHRKQVKELLLHGVGNDALAPLKKQYINLAMQPSTQ